MPRQTEPQRLEGLESILKKNYKNMSDAELMDEMRFIRRQRLSGTKVKNNKISKDKVSKKLDKLSIQQLQQLLESLDS